MLLEAPNIFIEKHNQVGAAEQRTTIPCRGGGTIGLRSNGDNGENKHFERRTAFSRGIFLVEKPIVRGSVMSSDKICERMSTNLEKAIRFHARWPQKAHEILIQNERFFFTKLFIRANVIRSIGKNWINFKGKIKGHSSQKVSERLLSNTNCMTFKESKFENNDSQTLH